MIQNHIKVSEPSPKGRGFTKRKEAVGTRMRKMEICMKLNQIKMVYIVGKN